MSVIIDNITLMNALKTLNLTCPNTRGGRNRHIGGGNPEENSENLILCTAQNILEGKEITTIINNDTIQEATTILNLSPDMWVLMAQQIVDKRSCLKNLLNAIKIPVETRAKIAGNVAKNTDKGPGSFIYFNNLIELYHDSFRKMIDEKYSTLGGFSLR